MNDMQVAVLEELRARFPLVYWREPRDRMGEWASFVYRVYTDTGEKELGVPFLLSGEMRSGDVRLTDGRSQAIRYVLEIVGASNYHPK